MKIRSLCLAAAACLAAPAHATGGLVCRTAGDRQMEVATGFGHVAGSPLISAQLVDDGRQVPVRWAQWWLDNSEVRLLLVSRDVEREELRLRARRNGHVYDGSVWRNGKRRWVRCREG